MEKEIIKKVHLCDVCGREGTLTTCEICGKEFCCCCEFIGFNPTHIRICKDHQENEDMKNIIRGFEDRYRKLDDDILNEIKKFGMLEKLK